MLEGQTEKYSVLIRTYQDRIYRYCVSLLHNEDDARDVAQESFIKAYKVLSQFKGQSSFYTWLYRIAYTHCLDFLRKRKRSKTDSLDSMLEDEPSHSASWAAEAPQDNKEDQKEFVKELLSILDEDEKAIVLMREQEELSYQEMAEALDLSIDGVKAKLYRIRQKIREHARHFTQVESSN